MKMRTNNCSSIRCHLTSISLLFFALLIGYANPAAALQQSPTSGCGKGGDSCAGELKCCAGYKCTNRDGWPMCVYQLTKSSSQAEPSGAAQLREEASGEDQPTDGGSGSARSLTDIQLGDMKMKLLPPCLDPSAHTVVLPFVGHYRTCFDSCYAPKTSNYGNYCNFETLRGYFCSDDADPVVSCGREVMCRYALCTPSATVSDYLGGCEGMEPDCETAPTTGQGWGLEFLVTCNAFAAVSESRLLEILEGDSVDIYNTPMAQTFCFLSCFSNYFYPQCPPQLQRFDDGMKAQ